MNPGDDIESNVTEIGQSQNAQKKHKILVVEDNLTSKLVVKSILLKLGYDVETASDGQEAIQMMNRMSFDLVLMDVQMPNLDGVQATRIIRSTESTRTPIIALTAVENTSDRDKCLAAGMDDFLAKPVSALTLTEIVARWLTDSRKPGIAFQQKTEATAKPDVSPKTDSHIESTDLFNSELFRSRVLCDESIADTVIRSYLEEMPTLMKNLRSAINRGDRSAIERYAHSMKSISGYITAGLLQQISKKIELTCTNCDMETLSGLMGEIDAQFRLFKLHIIKKQTSSQQTASDTH